MKLHLMEHRKAGGWAVFGGYWPEGKVHENAFALLDGQGREIPLQSEITARWADGSVQWSRHTAPAERLGPGGELMPRASGETERAQLQVTEERDGWTVTAGDFRIRVPREGEELLSACERDGKEMIRSVRPVLRLAHASETEETENGRKICFTRTETAELPGVIRSRTLETAGPLEAVFRFDGVHLEEGAEKMPFRIRAMIRADGEIQLDDTFFFLGDPESDRLAGWGLRFGTVLSGRPYQRHLRYLTDGAVYHDHPTQLFYWRKHLDPGLLAAQQRGETVPAAEELDEIAEDLPRWDRFCLTQDSAWHYSIRKKAWDGGCWLTGAEGKRAPGGMAVSDPERTVSFQVRDFWEKHPGALETENLSGEQPACTVWFYAPSAEPFDFRHYDRRTYPMGNYEGFDYMRPDPNGIAVTCRAAVYPSAGYTADEQLRAQNERIRNPAVYLADPEYYHAHRAFGYWSLPRKDTEVRAWTEKQLEAACDFYGEEAERRSWYGLFNYGDFMHTYEASRHQWRWDVGGYAWDNTELTPTYWLWLQFLRTGSERVFRLAEALSRHTSDVDMYHFGEMKGLGSRHNVRHWGCPCKEPRVSMAGHHRPLYYLTGDRRIGDCMEDSLQAAESLRAMPWFRREDGSLRVRSGPDWSALVSNWMTAYERTLDPRWRKMIEQGIEDLRKTPLGLSSGPQFGFSPEDGHLTYEGEMSGVSMHLQACMGGTEIWLETAERLGSRELADMVARNGRFFFLNAEERKRESEGLLEGREFGSPIYSAEMQAWAARETGDAGMAAEIWRRLLGLLYAEDRPEGFLGREEYARRPDGTPLTDIPWISTNFTAQWCLKAIVAAELIPEEMPGSFAELAAALREKPLPWKLYGA